MKNKFKKRYNQDYCRKMHRVEKQKSLTTYLQN